jgi:hypothetical protein
MRAFGLRVSASRCVLSWLAAACGTTNAPAPADAGACAFDAIYAASDYTSSGFGALAVAGAATYASSVDLGADPILAVSRGRAFLIARDEDAIFELDPRCATALGKVSVHDANHKGTTNPQDVAIATDGALWVPRYNFPSVLVMEPSGTPRASIDLSPYDDDANPNASAIRIVDVAGAAKAFVTLERLDDTQNPPKPKLTSQVLRIDVETRRIEAAIDLEGKNPFGLVEHEGAFFLAEPGDFYTNGEPLAGVERFDPATSTTHIFVREVDLGGSVAEVAITRGCGAAIVADAGSKNPTSLVTFDPETGAVLTPASRAVLGPTEGFDLQGLAWRGDLLFVGDRRHGDRGYPVHVLDRTGACTLRARDDTVFVQQKPVAIRAVP